ncbi:hypothetical protein [Candidatus Magnetaquicoccus inordinatus]|uniref:hypothetical protein n=1 Tax=Candidatus Magnetaquicoccus inordinatus TaxID=2496818 RepID=UPI00102C60EE|nr:hypothetical protein [Candidatus Magnetaquicoccus inordinatus]
MGISALELMREIINDEMIIGINSALNGNQFVTLKEINPDAKNNRVNLYLPEKSIVFTLDHPAQPKKSIYLDQGNKLLHSGCDYVVFCHYKNLYWFVMIELKSYDIKGIKNQFFCSSAFIRYLRELVYLRDGSSERYGLASIVFYSTRNVQKQTSHNSIPPRTFFHIGSCWYYKIANCKAFSLKKLLDEECDKKSDQHIDLFCFNRHSTSGQEATLQAKLIHINN